MYERGYLEIGGHVTQCARDGQRTMLWSQFCPPAFT